MKAGLLLLPLAQVLGGLLQRIIPNLATRYIARRHFSFKYKQWEVKKCQDLKLVTAELSLSFEAQWCTKCNSMAFHSELARVLLAQSLGGIFMCLPAKCHVNKSYGGNFQVFVMTGCTKGCCVSVMRCLPLVAYVFITCLRYLVSCCLGKIKHQTPQVRYGFYSPSPVRALNPGIPHPGWWS